MIKLDDLMIELTCRIDATDNGVDLLAIINYMTYEPTNNHGADDMSVSAEDKFYEIPNFIITIQSGCVRRRLLIRLPSVYRRRTSNTMNSMPQHKPN